MDTAGRGFPASPAPGGVALGHVQFMLLKQQLWALPLPFCALSLKGSSAEGPLGGLAAPRVAPG